MRTEDFEYFEYRTRSIFDLIIHSCGETIEM